MLHNHEISIPVDMREIKPLAELLIKERLSANGIPKGNYQVYVKISDKDEELRNRNAYSIRLANKNVWDDASGTNNLNHQLKIS